MSLQVLESAYRDERNQSGFSWQQQYFNLRRMQGISVFAVANSSILEHRGIPTPTLQAAISSRTVTRADELLHTGSPFQGTGQKFFTKSKGS